MIKCYLELYPAVADYAFWSCHKFWSHHEFQLTVVLHKQYEVLHNILSVLTLAHNAQELLSVEKTPTLTLAFPVYKTVIKAWEQLCVAIPELSHAITCRIQKALHVFGMVINPALKLGWIQEHWTLAQASQAEAAIKSEVKVNTEFARYIEDSVISAEDMDTAELISYWKDHQYMYFLLYQIAMDVLPVQALLVLSERVFLSSKLTCTAERNCITPENMEYLQVLKHSLHWPRHGQAGSSDTPELDFVLEHFENMPPGDN
ncbi:hypothetical protein FRC09_019803 [Ceratobasidium sp. 395]|nr:hypothetical protein FRC09_019803 [Ceratobasidium sp. 395]